MYKRLTPGSIFLNLLLGLLFLTLTGCDSLVPSYVRFYIFALCC